ncbi:MAG: cellulase family glycosylhydrolase, partial [Candidatus Marinimicrobia bacterium]|nr:cellulase family glycosylhydrolase [Candidatus Neomarinimicrobiota bacterium]
MKIRRGKDTVRTESQEIKRVAFPPVVPSGNKTVIVKNAQFTDAAGRTLLLQGINVGGSSKLPAHPVLPTVERTGFFETAREVSFVDRPFPLAEAPEHFARLYHWGYRFVRLLITWEAIEHAGPGRYDTAYLAYIRRIAELAAEHKISLFIDPHQDVWSRFSGGDGAPYWTFEA